MAPSRNRNNFPTESEYGKDDLRRNSMAPTAREMLPKRDGILLQIPLLQDKRSMLCRDFELLGEILLLYRRFDELTSLMKVL